MEKKIKHMEMIQAVITRMAGNSFMLKGWAVSLVAGIFSLAGINVDQLFFLIAFIPLILFWFLDPYYLQQERLYRALYDKVRQTNEEDIDFSMVAKVEEFTEEKNKYLSCLGSWFELGFYAVLAGVSAGIVILVNALN